jgi:hypothetical protein
MCRARPLTILLFIVWNNAWNSSFQLTSSDTTTREPSARLTLFVGESSNAQMGPVDSNVMN